MQYHGTPVDLVRSQLDALGRRITDDRGHDFMAQCPAHDDHTPSLHVSTGDAGRALLYCHAGCDEYDVTGELGLELCDLFIGGRDSWDALVRSSSGPRCYKGQGARDKGQGQGENVRGAKGEPPTSEGDAARATEEAERREREVEALLEAFEQGQINVTVRSLSVPDNAPEPVKRVAAFVSLVFAVREWAGMPAEAPLAARWVARYVPGVGHMTASRALRQLDECGALLCVGPWGRLRTHAFVPVFASVAAAGTDAVPEAFPAEAGRVEADDAGRVDEREVVGDHAAVRRAVADDAGEVLERGGGRGTAVAGAVESGHAGDYKAGSGGRPGNAILGWDP